jgi:biopolymer transport protein ExbB
MKRSILTASVAAAAFLLLPDLAFAEAGRVDIANRPHDLSVWTMFVNADIVVKIVMLGLLAASIGTWTVLIAKTIELGRARRRVRRSIEQLQDARGLAEARIALGSEDPLASAFITEALREFRLSSDLSASGGLKERIASSFAELERAEGLSMRRGTGLLASVGSTGPFVGLFGTVWGIMNSFIGISKAQTTNLAVVAPGIAEALLATAVGLFAAIPAVLIYNHLARQTSAYLELVANLSGELLRVVSRDLDRSAQHPSHVALRAAE